MAGPEYDLYIVKLFKRCKSGRMTKYTPSFDQEINLHPSQITGDIVSSNIREIIKKEMDIPDGVRCQADTDGSYIDGERQEQKKAFDALTQAHSDFTGNIQQIMEYIEKTYHVSFGTGGKDSLSKWAEIIHKIACPRGTNA